MYRGYVIRKSTIETLPRLLSQMNADNEYKQVRDNITQDKQQLREAIKREIMGSGGIIDADKLMKACMPQYQDYSIFISHSHRDVDYANNLSSYILKKFGLCCFIDSNIWLNSEEDIQKPFDRKYKSGNSFKYDDILKSTSHIHAMLSMSLLKMMDSCECCIFIQPEEKYVPMDSVSSPWIYEEVTMFNYIDKRLRRTARITESFSAKPKIIYNCDFSNMDSISLCDLLSNKRGNDWLDSLYAK